jgi:hypothetical protein
MESSSSRGNDIKVHPHTKVILLQRTGFLFFNFCCLLFIHYQYFESLLLANDFAKSGKKKVHITFQWIEQERTKKIPRQWRKEHCVACPPVQIHQQEFFCLFSTPKKELKWIYDQEV